MLSGNGRHRRPRQAPALVVAAGVTGSAIAIPLLGASGASAADGAAWDRVAECETGGAWSENSGNGYYGGLQLTQDDWEKYGGLAYASSADQASRSQQIRIAEKVLAAQGITAWPTCGLLAGLNKGSGPAATGTGPADGASSGSGATKAPESPRSPESSGPVDPSKSPDVSGSSGSSAPSASPEAVESTGTSGSSSSASGVPDAPSGDRDESVKSGTSDDSGSDSGSVSDSRNPAAPGHGGSGNSGREDAVSGPAGTGTSGGGRHRGAGADEVPADRRDGASSGRHVSRGEGAARDVVDGSYTVRHGDSLWAIADSLDLGGGWQGLYAGNKETVGADPDYILPGQKLAVSDETGEK
ncbi:hypothetical protein SUDANB58_02272 [Streptomyces sp. enrichment culture]|uniref:LysM peptidoglycan-binding domain-containing protein n=1 Tax=Streptomyces sp. enrichment culture TaxID=1795815 RepID=UPI003F542962